jgi:serine/threonine-protein kinase
MIPGYPQIGDIIADKYRIERRLGGGGMGTVFSATHLMTGRRFALKWMNTRAAYDNAARERFIREFQVAGSIMHANVAAVLDVGSREGALYIVMEYLEGESLGARIARGGPMAPADCVPIIVEAMRGVAAAHRIDIVHRDLKPDNIFICASPGRSGYDVKVLDFGVMKPVNERAEQMPTITARGMAVGTPPYMAPEQVLALPSMDHRIDIYAFGVILYEALSARLPYADVKGMQLLERIVRGGPPALSRAAAGVPIGLEATVMRALQKDPRRRFASLEDFAACLQPWAASASSFADLPQRDARTTTPPGGSVVPNDAGAYRTSVPDAQSARASRSATPPPLPARRAVTSEAAPVPGRVSIPTPAPPPAVAAVFRLSKLPQPKPHSALPPSEPKQASNGESVQTPVKVTTTADAPDEAQVAAVAAEMPVAFNTPWPDLRPAPIESLHEQLALPLDPTATATANDTPEASDHVAASAASPVLADPSNEMPRGFQTPWPDLRERPLATSGGSAEVQSEEAASQQAASVEPVDGRLAMRVDPADAEAGGRAASGEFVNGQKSSAEPSASSGTSSRIPRRSRVATLIPSVAPPAPTLPPVSPPVTQQPAAAPGLLAARARSVGSPPWVHPRADAGLKALPLSMEALAAALDGEGAGLEGVPFAERVTQPMRVAGSQPFALKAEEAPRALHDPPPSAAARNWQNGPSQDIWSIPTEFMQAPTRPRAIRSRTILTLVVVAAGVALSVASTLWNHADSSADAEIDDSIFLEPGPRSDDALFAPANQADVPAADPLAPMRDIFAPSPDDPPPTEDVYAPSHNAAPRSADIFAHSNDEVPPSADAIARSNDAISPTADVIAASRENVPPTADVLDRASAAHPSPNEALAPAPTPALEGVELKPALEPLAADSAREASAASANEASAASARDTSAASARDTSAASARDTSAAKPSTAVGSGRASGPPVTVRTAEPLPPAPASNAPSPLADGALEPARTLGPLPSTAASKEPAMERAAVATAPSAEAHSPVGTHEDPTKASTAASARTAQPPDTQRTNAHPDAARETTRDAPLSAAKTPSSALAAAPPARPQVSPAPDGTAIKAHTSKAPTSGSAGDVPTATPASTAESAPAPLALPKPEAAVQVSPLELGPAAIQPPLAPVDDSSAAALSPLKLTPAIAEPVTPSSSETSRAQQGPSESPRALPTATGAEATRTDPAPGVTVDLVRGDVAPASPAASDSARVTLGRDDSAHAGEVPSLAPSDRAQAERSAAAAAAPGAAAPSRPDAASEVSAPRPTPHATRSEPARANSASSDPSIATHANPDAVRAQAPRADPASPPSSVTPPSAQVESSSGAAAIRATAAPSRADSATDAPGPHGAQDSARAEPPHANSRSNTPPAWLADLDSTHSAASPAATAPHAPSEQPSEAAATRPTADAPRSNSTRDAPPLRAASATGSANANSQRSDSVADAPTTHAASDSAGSNTSPASAPTSAPAASAAAHSQSANTDPSSTPASRARSEGASSQVARSESAPASRAHDAANPTRSKAATDGPKNRAASEAGNPKRLAPPLAAGASPRATPPTEARAAGLKQPSPKPVAGAPTTAARAKAETAHETPAARTPKNAVRAKAEPARETPAARTATNPAPAKPERIRETPNAAASNPARAKSEPARKAPTAGAANTTRAKPDPARPSKAPAATRQAPPEPDSPAAVSSENAAPNGATPARKTSGVSLTDF